MRIWSSFQTNLFIQCYYFYYYYFCNKKQNLNFQYNVFPFILQNNLRFFHIEFKRMSRPHILWKFESFWNGQNDFHGFPVWFLVTLVFWVVRKSLGICNRNQKFFTRFWNYRTTYDLRMNHMNWTTGKELDNKALGNIQCFIELKMSFSHRQIIHN